jgi:Na+/proline symporter
MTDLNIQWIVVIAVLLLFYVISPWAKSAKDFFQGSEGKDKAPNALILTSGLVISWIFAKSIVNASDLGYSFGLLGGIGYAGYYVSFLVAGFVIYNLRTKGKWNSIHEFLTGKFGITATRIFSALIAIRLFNEVWSNTMVIGGFFGEAGTTSYYLAIVVFTALTLAYVLKGGLKSSLITDFIQMILFVLLLVLILGFVLPTMSNKPIDATMLGTWDFSHGLDFLVLALIQSLSYPFHDPVLTDRGFISDPKTTRKSYIWATVTGIICIIAFSLVGVSMRMNGSESSSIAALTKGFGLVAFISMNLIMITSATSTLDSSFSSFSKLIVIDIVKNKTVTIQKGRVAMIALAVLGTIPVFLNAEILKATTISGTMVLGLAPIFLFWRLNVPKISFFLAIGTGIVCGIAQLLNWVPTSWFWTNGKYADLLYINIVGLLLATALYVLPYFLMKWKRSTEA